MARKQNTMFSCMVGLAATTAALVLGCMTSQAQTWQFAMGRVALNDAARGGIVARANNAGFAVAGQSHNLDEDIYVTVADACHEVQWGFVYNIGGDDVARKIRQTHDGGYIVVGTTYNANTCGTHNDIFLLKLNANLAVQWVRTYGGVNMEEGRDVQVLADGYVVAGYTNTYGQGNYDALLMRTNNLGVPVWSRTYGGADDDYFMGCSIALNGDILAAGTTESFTPGADADIFLMRANQAAGIPVGGFPYHYGGNQYELAWHVIECLNGDLVTCGNTRSFGGNSEGYLLRTTNAGVVACNRTYGSTNVNGWDEILDIQEVDGNGFVTTGLFYNVPGGWGNYDMYTSHVDICFNPITETIHGGPGDDQGWAIVKAAGAPEYIIAGLTTSYGFGGEDLYLVRQQINGVSGCFDRTPPTIVTSPVVVRQGAAAVNAPLAIPNCQPQIVATWQDAWIGICTSCIGFSVAPEGFHLTNDGVRADDGRSFVSVDSAAMSISSVEPDASETGVSAYPNPVRSGEVLTMRYPSTGMAGVTVTVSDIAGKVVGEREEKDAGGTVTIATEGWRAGTYIVQVREGERSFTRRVVVADR